MSPGTRVFVYGFLALFFVTGVAQIDAWPFSGWELFSRVRTERQVGWEAVTVDAAGAERGVGFSSLPRSYRGGPHLFAAFRRFSPARIESSCRALVAAVAERGRSDVRALRVYRTVRHRSLDGGGRIRVVQGGRTLLYECARAPGLPAGIGAKV